MSNVHGEAEDYIGPSEEGHEHDLSRLEEPTTEEAEEYVGPHVAKDVDGTAPAADTPPSPAPLRPRGLSGLGASSAMTRLRSINRACTPRSKQCGGSLTPIRIGS